MKKIFFAYSNDSEDLDLYKELKPHFTQFVKKGFIRIIDKNELLAMAKDENKIREILLDSDITVPLISIDYLNNEECLMLLETAARENKVIIPVLLRACEWSEIEKLKSLEHHIIPDDKVPVTQHISKEGDEDNVLMGIARKVKAMVFENELKELPQRNNQSNPRTFYVVIAGIVLLIGILGAFISYTQWGDWKISAIAILMFGTIALLALKNVLFPTKFK